MTTAHLPTISEARERLRRELPVDLLEHSMRVARSARSLALAHGEDPDRAELAGLLHDVADAYSDVELLVLATEYGIPFSTTEARVPRLLHAQVGARLLNREWGICDEELLAAVADHTTGDVQMSRLARILFLADKLDSTDEPLGALDPIRELATTDLDQAVLELYSRRLRQLVAAHEPIDQRLVAARDSLIELTRQSAT